MEREAYIALRRKHLEAIRGLYNPDPRLLDTEPYQYQGLSFAEKLLGMEDDGLASIIELEDLEQGTRKVLGQLPICRCPVQMQLKRPSPQTGPAWQKPWQISFLRQDLLMRQSLPGRGMLLQTFLPQDSVHLPAALSVSPWTGMYTASFFPSGAPLS